MTVEIIVPCYNEEKCIVPFYNAILNEFDKNINDHNFIITYIDDGSTDLTLSNIKQLQQIDKDKIRYLSLSRNFGKEAAMYAGLANCIGDVVAIMDVDLQHPPFLLKEMINAITRDGFDCATARRVTRKGEPIFRSALSKGFYHVFNWVTGIELVPGSTDYRLMTKKVAEAIVKISERERFTKGIYSWIGFKNKWIEYENVERELGKTKWSLRGLLHYSYNGFMAFATTPLRGTVYLGMIIVLADLIWIIKILLDYLLFDIAIGSGITTILLVILFLGGVIITILGVIGEYLARIYLEIKHRPIYISKESSIESSINIK